MSTLHFGTNDRKVFTPISAAMGALSNGPGTIIVLVRRTVDGGTDFAGLTNSAYTSYYHALGIDNGDFIWDDDQLGVTVDLDPFTGQDLTNWWMYSVRWPTGTAQLERFGWRNQTGSGAGSPGAWTFGNASINNTGQRAGPGTGGYVTLGYYGDWSIGQKDMGVAFFFDRQFSDGDHGDFRKTSDLVNHVGGAPIFACEINATTLIDLMGGSTYSSANSSGTTLTGPDPDNWIFDGIGGSNPLPSLVMPPYQLT